MLLILSLKYDFFLLLFMRVRVYFGLSSWAKYFWVQITDFATMGGGRMIKSYMVSKFGISTMCTSEMRRSHNSFLLPSFVRVSWKRLFTCCKHWSIKMQAASGLHSNSRCTLYSRHREVCKNNNS